MECESRFYWERFHEAEELFLLFIEECKKQNEAIASLEEKLLAGTSTRLLDWVDHVLMAETVQIRSRLEDLGFVRQTDTDFQAYVHPGALLPRVVLTDDPSSQKTGLALRVEEISNFLHVNQFHGDIEGTPLSAYRRSLLSTENSTVLMVVERRGSRDYTPTYPGNEYLQQYLEAVELWKKLPRSMEDEGQAFSEMLKGASEITDRLGPDMAAHIVCMCERDYWMSRNYAARVQKMRQDILGLGWANHDHHTFRSSRHHFTRLVDLFTRLGFRKRERFYAGKEAGWGAQVMENPNAGLALFLDVDLAPEEVAVDFAEQGLSERDELGTVGLWCALHGDSILKAGMHHIAANVLFDRLTQDLSAYHIEFMSPFSDFSYLRQSFSKGEKWDVYPGRVRRLLDSNRIDKRQADTFLRQGVIGSHLENIQRREGFKGFNQKNVSAIIKETDPRRQNTS